MPRKILLFLSTGHLQARTWKDGVLSAPQQFTDSPDGRDQFDAFLQVHRDPVLMLADFVEEDFHYEAVPHLRGGDRAALLQRKFEQYYRSTPFRQALPQRRQQDGRRDDEMLFCALTNPALTAPWLEIMQRNSVPLAGIYSVPGISRPLIEGIASDHLLLLSWEKHAGLRQTYFDEQRLHFSRLTPIGEGTAFSELVDSEAARTHQYLRSLGLLAPGDMLDVYIVCDAQDRREMEANLFANPNIRYGYLDIQELGQRFRTSAGHAGSDASSLFLSLLAARPPRSSYATPAHTHFYRLRQLNHALFALGGAFAAISLLWGAFNLWEGSRLAAENETLKVQTSLVLQQAEQTTRGLPRELSTAADMKAAVLLTRKLASYSPPPQEILAELAATLDSYARIRVNELSWQAGVAPDAQTAGAAALPAQTMLLNGELEGMAGDYRGALDYLERFQHTLSQRGYKVTALSLPLDVSPKGSISTAAMENNGTPAQFSLKIVWSPKE